MILLGLDTTGAYCSACLVRNNQTLALMSEKIGRGHAERLAPMVAELFDETGLNASDVDRLAVCTGPGSFTGLRVALSFAKGFALPRTLPIIGLNSLAVAHLMADAEKGDRVVFQDVKRGQIMFDVFCSKAPIPTTPPQIGTLKDMKAVAERAQLDVVEVDYIDVSVMARAAADLNPADYPADPLYARPPDAKLPGGVSVSA